MAPIEHTMKRRPGGGGDSENYLYTPGISLARGERRPGTTFSAPEITVDNLLRGRILVFPQRKLPAIDN